MTTNSTPYRTHDIDLDAITPYEGPTHGASECYLCGRPLRAATVYLVHPVEGGLSMLHRDDEEAHSEHGDPAADLGAQYVGPTCARKIPAAYKVKTTNPDA